MHYRVEEVSLSHTLIRTDYGNFLLILVSKKYSVTD